MLERNNLSKTLAAAAAIVGRENVSAGESAVLAYSCDAGLSKARPDAVITFDETAQVCPVLKVLAENRVPFVPRMAGTNLSGGTIPIKGGVVLNLVRLNKIEMIDTAARAAVVEPGVVNQALQEELAKFGYFYPPDPASQKVSTIGGNIGENAGGPRCLKYGVTLNNVLKLEIATPRGERKILDFADGPDLVSLMCGSEGTLGVVLKAWLKIEPLKRFVKTAAAAFPGMDKALEAVNSVISSGIVPAALEIMDKTAVDAAREEELSIALENAGAVLIVEMDSDNETEILRDMAVARRACETCQSLLFKSADEPAEREKLWTARKNAYPAMARLDCNVLVEDGVVPRPNLGRALGAVNAALDENNLRASVLFHAGDGNIHPNIVFDERDIYQIKRVKKAAREMLRSFVDLGGFISGEHGIGVEKRMAMAWQYPQKTLRLFKKIKNALDPDNLANPDKIIPLALENRNECCLKKESLSPEVKRLMEEVSRRQGQKIKSFVSGSGSSGKRFGGKPLSAEGLGNILDFDGKNLTLKAEAGAKIETLSEFLRRENLEFRFPPYKGTVGGLIASRHFFVQEKSPDEPFARAVLTRDFLLGTDIITPDGEFHELGGKTLKNVSGYDLARLMIGSMGAYALIVSATFRVDNRIKTILNPDRRRGRPNGLHAAVKKVFDPENLFNPDIYDGLL